MVYFNNEYQLPSRFDPKDIIIDVGAHIGSFAFASLVRGANHIISIEAHPENYNHAQHHLKDYINDGRLDLRWGAVWRSDNSHDTVTYGDFSILADNKINTGNVEVYATTDGQTIPQFSLDELITNHHIRLLKLDCEGSEFPILLTSKRLHQVDEIVGEFHEFGGEYDDYQPNFYLPHYDRYTVDILITYLQSQGFTTEYHRHQRYDDSDWTPIRLGYFRARRFDSL